MFFRKKEWIFKTNKLKDYLPIGSIVKLKEEYLNIYNLPDDLYLITQYRGINIFKKEKGRKYEVDYWAKIGYPVFGEGGSDFCFDNEDVREVVFRGYDGDQRTEFCNEVDLVLEAYNGK